MIHPDTELRFASPSIGYGVFATRLIPRGTITWVQDRLDQSFTPAALELLPPGYHAIVEKYSFIDSHGLFVLCWDHARFMNHSCNPSCRSAGYDFEVAVRDIAPGEELTDDYGSLNLETAFECSCGLPGCRGRIQPGDLMTFGDDWDRMVAGPFRLIPAVPQPLWGFLENREPVEAALAGQRPIASVKASYVDAAALHCGNRGPHAHRT